MTPLERALLKALRDPVLFSSAILNRPLRGYQATPIRAIYDSIRMRQGLTFTLMFARQMGKNETSAHLECFLLNRYSHKGGTIIKTAPTYSPQVINSKLRLLTMLQNPLNQSQWCQAEGYIVSVGDAKALFVSGRPEAHTVGLTASLLLEVDEAQDFDEQKYSKDFRPMASSTNATTVLYGTAWTGDTLLEKQIATNKELEAHDHIQRHFEYDWQVLVAISPDYAAFVDAERARLGEDHPLFRTQYKLQAIKGQNRFLTIQHAAQLSGNHARQSEPTAGATYVAGIDLAGEEEQDLSSILKQPDSEHDSVVVTIAEVTPAAATDLVTEPIARVVEHYKWTGQKHRALYTTLVDILRNVWHCSHVTIDATGVGAGVASFLQDALGTHIVEQFTFTSQSKSQLGYDLLSAINAGRLKVYSQNADEETLQTFWRELMHARYEIRANQAMTFFVPEEEGHDDFLMSLALCSHAAGGLTILPASASVHPQSQYQDGRY